MPLYHQPIKKRPIFVFSNKKDKIVGKEEDDYIINNDEEIFDYQNNNINSNSGNIKKINRNTKIQKTSNKSQAGNWIKEAKAKYKQEKNLICNIMNNTDSRIITNNRKQKKILGLNRNLSILQDKSI